MGKWIAGMAVVLLAGCSTVKTGSYRPDSPKERTAYRRASKMIALADVQEDRGAYLEQMVAWAGVIEDVKFRQTERAVQIAFSVRQHDFDWLEPQGEALYELSTESDGIFFAGLSVPMPTQISYLKGLAEKGDMLIVYGKPVPGNGTVQLRAKTVRAIDRQDFAIIDPATDEVVEEVAAVE